LRLLGDGLDDWHPDVRAQARRSLQELAGKEEWRKRGISGGARVLAAGRRRGLGQGGVPLTGVDYKTAGGGALALVSVSPGEVALTAGWALRRLAVPETLPAITKYVGGTRTKAFATAATPAEQTVPLDYIELQLAQLIQLLGQQKYTPADPVLRE